MNSQRFLAHASILQIKIGAREKQSNFTSCRGDDKFPQTRKNHTTACGQEKELPFTALGPVVLMLTRVNY